MTSWLMREWAAAGVLAGAVALYGCGSDDSTTTSPASTAKATPAATTATVAPAATTEATPAPPDALRGSWKRTMKARDWRSVGSGYPTGTWRFDVNDKGEMAVYLPHTEEVDFTTDVTVKGRSLTIDTIPVCPGITGRYTWRASGDKLTLTVVADDDCKPRAALFGGTWTRRS